MEMPGSPVTLRASQTFEMVVQALVGSVDFVSLNLISGWARDELRPDTAVSLTISDNGEPIGHVVANVYRDDLNDAGMGTGRHAFEFSVSLAPFETHVIRVRRDSDGKEIPGSPVTLYPVESSVDQSAAELLTGSLDVTNCSMVSGWVRDTLQPNNPISLDHYHQRRICRAPVGELLSRRPESRPALVMAALLSISISRFRSLHSRPCNSGDTGNRRRRVPGSPITLRASRSFDRGIEESLSRALNRCGSVEDLPRKIDFLVGQIDHLLQQNADAESLRTERVRYRNLVQRWKSEPPQDVASATTSVSPASVTRACHRRTIAEIRTRCGIGRYS